MYDQFPPSKIFFKELLRAVFHFGQLQPFELFLYGLVKLFCGKLVVRIEMMPFAADDDGCPAEYPREDEPQ